MTSGKRGKVPQVRLVDPNVEPTDEELELLMESVMAGVKERAEKAEAAFQKQMEPVFGRGYRANITHER